MSSYFVSPSGSDSNPGTLAAPFLTIAHGLGVLAAGDTLNIRAGTYDETIWESMVVTGTLANPIVIQAYLGEAVILQPSAECIALRFETSARSYITVRGLVLDQALATCTTEPIALIDANQSNLTIQDCEIKNGAANGVELAGSDHLLTGLLVHDCAGAGISADASDSTFQDIESHTNGGDGLFIQGTGNLIERVSAHDNTGGRGVSVEDDCRVTNSLAFLNTLAGIRVANASGAQIFNNTSAKNTGFGIELAASAAATEVKNNIAWNNTAGEIDDSGSSTVASNNLTTDPDFTDETGNDFHLESTSDAIDTGTDLSAEGVTDDYAGNPRPINDLYDIGAYEYFSESAPISHEGAGSAAGSSSASGVGAALGAEAVGAAAGSSTVSGIAAGLSSQGVGATAGAATVTGIAQVVIDQQSENPKTYLLRVRDARIGANGIIEFDLVREDLSIYDAHGLSPLLGAGNLGGSPPPPAPDPTTDDSDQSKPGSTTLALLDIPQLLGDHNGPGFYAAATGPNDGWVGAVLYEKVGSEYIERAQLDQRAAIGTANTKLASGPVTTFDVSGRTYVYDDTNTVDVTLRDGVSALASVSDADLLAGVNAAALGAAGRWEIILFGTATQLDTRKWQLSHLLRGMKGTEWAVGLHQTGDTFVLLDTSLRRISDAFSDLDVSRTFRPVSIGNQFDSGSNRPFTDAGVSLKPLSPVYVRGEEDGDQNRIIRWYRRSRLDGLAGRDTYDPAPPLGETTERYEVDILNAAGDTVLRTISATTEQASYTAAQQTTDFGSVPATLKVCIYQLSETRGRGYSGCATISSFDGVDVTPADEKPYLPTCTVPGKIRAALTILNIPVTHHVFFEIDFAGSRAVVGVAPTADQEFSIQKNGVEIGTITFSAGQTVGVFDAASSNIFSTADVLTVITPDPQDATMADLGFSLAGSRI